MSTQGIYNLYDRCPTCGAVICYNEELQAVRCGVCGREFLTIEFAGERLKMEKSLKAKDELAAKLREAEREAGQSMSYAMISYSSRNQSSADAMRAFLERNGVKTWMAPGDIPPGYRYAQVINKAIKGCGCMVLMLSEESQDSQWVASELERAKNYRKPIIPVQISDVVLNDEFEFYISASQIVAVQRIDESSPECQRILASVRVMTGDTEVFQPVKPKVEPIAYSPETPPSPVQEDEPVESRYDLLARIGQGMVGTAWQAQDKLNGSMVVVKRYNTYFAQELACFYDDDVRKALLALEHPYLCRIHRIAGGREPYMVMDLLQGETLEEYMKFRVMSLQARVALFMEILSGLNEMHQHGLYYGDLTPGNVMVVNGHACLCDFSESNFFDRTPPDRTIVIDKHISHERYHGSRIDARSDVYEAGLLLDFMTKNVITRDRALDALMQGKEIDYFWDKVSNRQEAAVVRMIKAALHLRKEDRPANAGELLRMLHQEPWA